MKRHIFRRFAPSLLGLALATTTISGVSAAPASVPFGITHSASIEVVGAPCSVASNMLEDNQSIRLFPEHLAYKLPSTVTVIGPNGTPTTLAQGTLVDSYFIHADWVNQGKNAPNVFTGNLTFAQPLLGIIKDSSALVASTPVLGAPSTTYGTNDDQGLESYDDSATFSNNGQTVNLKLSVWNANDQLRVITAASPSINPSTSVEVIGAPCSVIENALESDTSIRMFPERLNYTLLTDLTVNGKLFAAGTRVNVYLIHADRVGDQQGMYKNLSGSVSFDTPILGVITSGAKLMATHSTLGATFDPDIHTSYSARSDQGLESDDRVRVSVDKTRLDLSFKVWNVVDQVRVITQAP